MQKTATDSDSPWRSSLRQLRRNRAAMIALGVLFFMVIVTLLAPIYAHDIAHDNPFASNLQGRIKIGNHYRNVMQSNTQGLGLGVTPIGPTWHFSKYFLGADSLGRDVFARILYGGRVTLLIGFSSGLICITVATVLGMLAGYFGRATDWIISRAPRHRLGLSDLSARDLALGDSGDERTRPRHHPHRRRLTAVADPDHRLGLRPLRGPAGTRHRLLVEGT